MELLITLILSSACVAHDFRVLYDVTFVTCVVEKRGESVYLTANSLDRKRVLIDGKEMK